MMGQAKPSPSCWVGRSQVLRALQGTVQGLMAAVTDVPRCGRLGYTSALPACWEQTCSVLLRVKQCLCNGWCGAAVRGL